MHTYDPVFKRIIIDNVIIGGTRILWEMNPHFLDPGPYTFQLQVGHTGLDEADDWEDVGTPVVDTYFTFDLDQRVWGKTLDSHYRVKLSTSLGTYYSEPENSDGHLSKRDWLNAREVIRKELLRHRILTSPEGYLLKVRRYGPRCTICSDQFTEEVSRSNCPECYGTGFENGYFDPMSACFADVGTDKNRDHRVADKGMDKEDVIQARFIGDPQLYSYDVWANKTSGERYYLHTVGISSQVRGIAIIYDAELRLAPFNDVVYTVPIDTGFLPTRRRASATMETLREVCRAKPKPSLNYMEVALQELKTRRRTRSSRR